MKNAAFVLLSVVMLVVLLIVPAVSYTDEETDDLYTTIVPIMSLDSTKTMCMQQGFVVMAVTVAKEDMEKAGKR